MSDDAELRAAALLAELRDAEPPPGDDLAGAVVRHARWQREVRHILVSISTAAGGAGHGLAALLRGR